MSEADLDHQKRVLLADILGVSITDLTVLKPILHPDQEKIFQEKLHKLKKGYPLDYLLQSINFANIKLSLTPNVLIPRQETEEWLCWLIKQDFFKLIIQNNSLSLLDIGTGSGAIGLTLSSYFREVFLVDISKQALKTCELNSKLNRITNTKFIRSNLLGSFSFEKQSNSKKQFIDLKNTVLIANLPYLPSSDEIELSKTNVQYEPKLALYSGKTGLNLFKRLLSQFKDLPNLVVFELDPRNIHLAQNLLSKKYPNNFIWKDGFGRDRVLIGQI